MWIVNIGNALAPTLCFLAGFRFAPFLFAFFTLYAFLFTLQSFLTYDLDTLTDTGNAFLAFQCITFFAALYGTITSSISTCKRHHEEEATLHLPKTVIAWLVFASLGAGCWMAAMFIPLSDVTSDQVWIQYATGFVAAFVLMFPFIIPVFFIKKKVRAKQIRFIFYSGFGAMIGWPCVSCLFLFFLFLVKQ